jgi:outer membrane protein OmpA-like peptidoglycan-associated protein
MTSSKGTFLRTVGLGLTAASCVALANTTTALANDCEPTALGAGDGRFSTCVDVENFWPRPGEGPFQTVGSTRTVAANEVATTMVLSYARAPLRLQGGAPDTEPRTIGVVDDLFSATLGLALGITDSLELTATAPFTLYQAGSGYGPLTGAPAELPRSAVRDARFGFGYSLVSRARVADAEGFGLATRFEFAAPFGAASPFAGARSGTAIPSVGLDYRVGRWTAGLELGARLRPDAELGASVWGSQFATALGIDALVVEELGLGVSAEAFALAPLTIASTSTETRVPAEWLATARIAPFLAGDLGFAVSGGGPVPITEGAPTTPNYRLTARVNYTPRGLDSDADGVLDRYDGCLREPEDRDGFEDADGCPDPDNDGDRIPDAKDACRDEPETMDGFDDADGCPDLDDDRDGIPDEEDACRNEPEDFDRFQDRDGCPDPDNDGDGILDRADACPEAREDIDQVRDQDGCPDPDNDGDGVLDEQDRCPSLKEDADGFEDGDGCPEPDNDRDGVLDAADACPDASETLDGNDDDDGCPEPGATSDVSVGASGRVVFSRTPRFDVGRGALPAVLAAQVRRAARLLRARGPNHVVIVEAYADRRGASDRASQELAAARADAVRAVLASEGIPPESITAASGDLSAKRPADADPLEITITAVSRAP